MATRLKVSAAIIATAFAITGFTEWGIIGSVSSPLPNPNATGDAFLSLLIGSVSLFIAIVLWIWTLST